MIQVSNIQILYQVLIPFKFTTHLILQLPDFFLIDWFFRSNNCNPFKFGKIPKNTHNYSSNFRRILY